MSAKNTRTGCTGMSSVSRNRPDKDGTHRAQFDRNKRKIFKTQTICGICGKPVDFSLKYPHPLSPTVDHIIPIAKGGHPSDISNLQLAHFQCNRLKSDKVSVPDVQQGQQGSEDSGTITKIISNRILPQSMDWKSYRAD